MYFTVVPEERSAFGAEGLTYYFDEDLPLGTLVEIPIGKRLATGIILGKAVENPLKDIDIRAIVRVLSATPLLDQTSILLLQWMKQYYFITSRQALQVFLPSPPWKRLLEKKEVVLIFCSKKTQKGKKQQELMEYMKEKQEQSEETALSDTQTSKATLNSLISQGILKREERVREHMPREWKAIENQKKMDDSAERATTLVIDNHSLSDRMEWYACLATKQWNEKRSTLILFPNIFLAEEGYEMLRQLLPEAEVVRLHGNTLGSDEKKILMRATEEKPIIIVGTKVALFLPILHLGLIILDTEHDRSWKNEQTPRYHARLIAEMKARYVNASLVLSSPSPSLDSLQHTQEKNGIAGRYTLLERIAPREGHQRKIHIVDLSDADCGTLYPITTPLLLALSEQMKKKEASVLLLNQRGTGSKMMCMTCKNVLKAEHAEFPYQVITRGNVPWLIDRASGEMHPVPEYCPECQGTQLRSLGAGTERVEEILKQQFPEARIVRADSDTLNSPKMMKGIIETMNQGNIDILLGTQSVLSAIDSHRVTLVAMLVADKGLSSHDVRAGERIFDTISLIVQKMYSKGMAFIQTFRKDAPEIRYAIEEDPLGYMKHELPLREAYNYPPSTRLIDLILRETHREAPALLERLKPYAKKYDVNVSLWEKKSAFNFASVIRLRGNRVREMLPIIPRKGVVINIDPVE